MLAIAIVAATLEAAPAARDAAAPDAADQSILQFLAQAVPQPVYRATRRLEARNGSRRGWLEAVTEYSPRTGFHYTVTAEGGSDSIRSKVLRAVLDGERDVIARGETARAALVRANYTFAAGGVDGEGLARVLLSPRRKDPALVSGQMFLQPGDGRLVRIEGRLAKSPSFWVKQVDIVRSYERVGGVVVPVMLESSAQVRFMGGATFQMTYTYTHVNGSVVTR